MNTEYRKEMVQCAAVVIAALQTYDRGHTAMDATGVRHFKSILYEIELERERQEAKWGSQNHGPEHWHTILSEETGEVARAILEGKV